MVSSCSGSTSESACACACSSYGLSEGDCALDYGGAWTCSGGCMSWLASCW